MTESLANEYDLVSTDALVALAAMSMANESAIVAVRVIPHCRSAANPNVLCIVPP